MFKIKTIKIDTTPRVLVTRLRTTSDKQSNIFYYNVDCISKIEKLNDMADYHGIMQYLSANGHALGPEACEVALKQLPFTYEWITKYSNIFKKMLSSDAFISSLTQVQSNRLGGFFPIRDIASN
ncbi:hypothetical protein [Aliivibrio fischeri]|uniref:hypothetical protein n=1 Tax=Aliivibrio fischeri TaxID=668 RepID=UPI0007C49C30|nr:hypothetical protein [Aliivibrio fischeri]